MSAAAILAVLLLAAPTGVAPAPLDSAACEAIPGAPDEGPRFEDPNGVFSLNLPSSWMQRESGALGVSQADAATHGDRAVFELRQGDVHRLLIARVVTPTGTREQDAARFAKDHKIAVLGAVSIAGAPCLLAASMGAGHARELTTLCDLQVKGTPARFVADLIYLDSDSCNHGAEMGAYAHDLKWGASVKPGAR
ncbi:MAG TPA: hypothetical protein VG407_08540 [Caulobacteraceae bacterium]|jgi:hypothetical protein|nr:hypothetical protein [Caulobacteraceae bacterium]